MSNNSSRSTSTNNFLMLQDKIETQKGENKILRQKLQSKSEALVILSQELDKVRNECEDYRELTRRYVLLTGCTEGFQPSIFLSYVDGLV